MSASRRSSCRIFAVLAVASACVGCDRLDMYDEPRVEPLEESRFFRDGMTARPQVEGTIARGDLRDDEAFYTGRLANAPVPRIPPQVAELVYERRLAADPKADRSSTDAAKRMALLERGRERFDIFCSACHGRLGDGDGMIVRRGFRRPPTFAQERLRNAPAGHFFDVITVGFGAMPSYANRIEPLDRWAITAYVRALQLRTNAAPDDVPAERRAELDSVAAPSANPVAEGAR